MKKLTLTLLAAALGLAALPATSHARFVFTLAQTGGDLTLTGTGSLNITGLTSNTNSSGNGLRPSQATVLVGSSGGMLFNGLTGPSSFGTVAGFTAATTSTGNYVGISGSQGYFVVPNAYVSGTTLNNSATFTGQTLAGLGITAGTYNYSFNTGTNADSVVLNIVPAVPEPSTWAFVGAGAGLLGCATLRRRGTARLA